MIGSIVADNTFTGTGSLVSTYGAVTPKLGDLILMGICVAKSSAGASTINNPNSSLWTVGQNNKDNGAVDATLGWMIRWADGTSNDNAPTITITATSPTSLGRALVVRGYRFGTALPLDASAGNTAIAGAAGSITDTAITASQPNEDIFAIAATRQPLGVSGEAFSGGAAIQGSVLNSGNAYLAIGIGTLLTIGATASPVYSWTGGGTGSAEVIKTLGFGAASSILPDERRMRRNSLLRR